MGIKDNFDVLIKETQTLIEDILAFNKQYVGELKLKKESNDKVFTSIENSLTGFYEILSKFDFPSTNLISQEKISFVVLSMESCFKTELALILDLVLRLPKNAPCSSTNVSQG